MLTEANFKEAAEHFSKKGWKFEYNIDDSGTTFFWFKIHSNRVQQDNVCAFNGTFDLKRYGDTDALIKLVEQSEKMLYFQSYISPVLYKAYKQVEFDIYKKFFQLEQHGHEFPKELTITMDLKFNL